MFTISDLHVKADDKEILKGFNLTINEAETHILMGPNGAGKSTVCKSILHHPHYEITSGHISYQGKDLTNSLNTDNIDIDDMDENGGMKGPPELVPVEPEIRERTVIQTRIVEKEPSFLGFLGRELVSQVSPEIPAIAQELWEEHKATKARKERREALEEQRRIAALQRDAAEKQLELERLKAKEREAEEKRQREAKLTNDQRQIISLAKTLNEAHNGFIRDMTKDEACKSLVRAFIYFVMFIMEIQNVQQARIRDEETGDYIDGAEWFAALPWGEFLQDFNLLLKANPSWLKGSQALILSEAFGRDVIVEGEYVPITGAELTSCLRRIT